MRAIVLLILMCLTPVARAEDKPTLVSLDYCADQFVLALADPEQILALSKDAEKPFSHLRDEARQFPKVRALTEDVIALQPDKIVRSWGGDARALSLYQRFGIETVQLGYASDFDGVAVVTRTVAEAIGQVERGEARIAAMPPARPSSGVSALYLSEGGVTGGQGTMMDAILQAAGLSNAVTTQGWQAVSLEALVIDPPDFIVTAFFGFDDKAHDQWSLGRHPVLKRIFANARTVQLDESRLTCPAWFVADEAAALYEALE